MENPEGVPQTPPFAMENPEGVPQTPPFAMENPVAMGAQQGFSKPIR